MIGETTINARKFDGTVHRSWKAELIRSDSRLLIFRGVFDREVDHPELGTIERGTVSYEYYWLDRWYNVFRFQQPDGRFRNFYCNVNMPPTFNDGVLDYIDLDLDVLVWPGLAPEILDLDDFQSNARQYNYPQSVRDSAHQALSTLTAMVERGDFPFGNIEEEPYGTQNSNHKQT